MSYTCAQCFATSLDEAAPDGWQSQTVGLVERPVNEFWLCPACKPAPQPRVPVEPARKRIFVASPYRGKTHGKTTENVFRAQDYCLDVIKAGHAPFAPHLLYPTFMNDENAEQRAAGIACGLAFLAVCDELWAYGPVSEGMAMEIEEAKRLGKPVRYFAMGGPDGHADPLRRLPQGVKGGAVTAPLDLAALKALALEVKPGIPTSLYAESTDARFRAAAPQFAAMIDALSAEKAARASAEARAARVLTDCSRCGRSLSGDGDCYGCGMDRQAEAVAVEKAARERAEKEHGAELLKAAWDRDKANECANAAEVRVKALEARLKEMAVAEIAAMKTLNDLSDTALKVEKRAEQAEARLKAVLELVSHWNMTNEAWKAFERVARGEEKPWSPV